MKYFSGISIALYLISVGAHEYLFVSAMVTR